MADVQPCLLRTTVLDDEVIKVDLLVRSMSNEAVTSGLDQRHALAVESGIQNRLRSRRT